MTRKATFRALTALLITTGAYAFAQPTIDWSTIDGGGEMSSTGAGFELSGTIGQPDAGVMTGGSFELRGGFWFTAAPEGCNCRGDVNGDSFLNGADIQAFVDCMLAGGADCACANLDGAPGLDVSDVALFVDALLAGAVCP